MEEERDPLANDGEFIHEPISTRDNLFCCQVCNIMMIGFNKYNLRERTAIIKAGRPTPQMAFMARNTGKGTKKTFNLDTYNSFEWLTGCERRGKLFCWACLLFCETDHAWKTTGVSDLPNIHSIIRRHLLSPHHIESMIKLKTYDKSDSDDPWENPEMAMRKSEGDQFKRREVLKKFIRLICFLADHRRSPKALAEVDPTDPIENGKYVDFIDLLGKFDYMLGEKLIREKFLTSSIRNNLIISIDSVIYRKIKEEILETNFVSLILDEVAELGDTVLISTILRFTTRSGCTRERFFNFQEVPIARKAESLFEIICANVNFLECKSKVISQSYDGGVVKAYELFNLQNRVKELCPNSLFIYYSGHKLSLILKQSLSVMKECKQFFFTISGISSMFQKSKKLRTELNLLIRKKNPDATDISWDFDGNFLKNFLEMRQPLIELMVMVLNSQEGWDFEIVFASSGYLSVIRSDVTFNMLLLFLSEVFSMADELSDSFKCDGSNVSNCIKKVIDFTNFIKDKKDMFIFLYEETLDLLDDPEPPVKQTKFDDDECTNESYQTLFEDVISNIIVQLNARFCDLSKLNFLVLTKFKSNESLKESSEGLWISLKNSYSDCFNMAALIAEHRVLFESLQFEKTDPKSVMKYLRRLNIDTQTAKFCEFVLTLPISGTTSTFQRVKDYIQSSSIGHKLSPLALISVEKDLVDRLSEQKQFYDEVLEEFSKREPHLH